MLLITSAVVLLLGLLIVRSAFRREISNTAGLDPTQFASIAIGLVMTVAGCAGVIFSLVGRLVKR